MNQEILERLYGNNPGPGMTVRRHEWTPVIQQPRSMKSIIKVAQVATKQPMLRYIADHPWCCSPDIAAALGRPTNSATSVLTELVREGRLKRRGRVRHYEYALP